MKYRRTPTRGFTLIELAVVMAILAIAATMAAPSMRDFIIRNNTAAVANEFTLSLLETRTRARNMCVSMCRTTTAMDALPSCAGAGDDWKDGWIIFRNPACNGTVTDPTIDQIIRVVQPLNADFTLLSNAASPNGHLMVDAEGHFRVSDVGGFLLRYRSETRPSNRLICLDALGNTVTKAYNGAC